LLLSLKDTGIPDEAFFATAALWLQSTAAVSPTDILHAWFDSFSPNQSILHPFVGSFLPTLETEQTRAENRWRGHEISQ
jgi:hypothetical protein